MKIPLWLKATIMTAIAVGIFALLRYYFGYQPLLADVSAFAGFYSAFGVVFGIMAGFVLITVWEQYTAVESSIEVEVRGLQVIGILADSLKDKKSSKLIKQRLQKYLRSAISEWKDLASRKESAAAAEDFYVLLTSVGAFETRDMKSNDQALLQDLIDELRQLSRARTIRISASKTQMPPTSWVLILFLSIALVATEYLLGVVNPIIAYAMIISIAGVTSLVVTIVHDLDNPFNGEWNVSPAAFESILKRMST